MRMQKLASLHKRIGNLRKEVDQPNEYIEIGTSLYDS